MSCHRPSSTCTQVRAPRSPTSPKNKCSSANNAFRAPTSPANRSYTILVWAETVYPGSHIPLTPASAIALPCSPSFDSTRLPQAFRRPSLTHVGSWRSVSSTRGRIPSTSFLDFVDTLRTLSHPIPTTPFPADVEFDFAASDYTSIFRRYRRLHPITSDVRIIVRQIPVAKSELFVCQHETSPIAAKLTSERTLCGGR